MNNATRASVSLAAGVLFGFGLSIAQMIDPAKVINFLDIAGSWDPSLAFVMIGALCVNILANRFILRQDKPLFNSHFQLPGRADLDGKLIAGACVFGIGWGMAGYCPGPLLTSISFVNEHILTVLAGYIIGTWITKRFMHKKIFTFRASV